MNPWRLSELHARMRLRQQWVASAFFAAISLFTALDLVADVREASWRHAAVEGAILACGGGAFAWMWGENRRLARRESELARSLHAAAADAARWRAEANELLTGLGAAIDRQFEAWLLSPAEKEVGLLLLKGLALKEIAGLRGTTERTVRQQAQEVYRKSSLTGRAELAAFFLEDLLLPNARS